MNGNSLTARPRKCGPRCKKIEVFRTGSGFVFNPIHNVQALVPVENLLAMYEAVGQYR
jgi:uroporphyrinogen-III decarboxylase